jgi:hypothetical protein
MHTELSSFLTQVWENREAILDFSPAGNLAKVRDNVYDLYAPRFRAVEETLAQSYNDEVNRITAPPGSGWRISRRDSFFVWTNSAANQSVSHRIYVNALPAHAPTVFRRLLECANRQVSREPPPAPPGQRRPGEGMDLKTAYVALARRGQFGEILAGAKIAFAEEAYGGRADVIVAYLNDEAGLASVSLLAQRIASWGRFYGNDHPPMTRQLAFGISTGAEVTRVQRDIGTSFGEVRSGLVARALSEAVTGRVPPESGPIPPARGPRSPNRLDFVQIVGRLFKAHGIDVDAPWG